MNARLPVLDLKGLPPQPHVTVLQAMRDYVTEWAIPEGLNIQRTTSTLWRGVTIFGWDRNIATMGRADSREYARIRKEQGVGPGTIIREITCIGAAIHHEKREGRISVDVQFWRPKAPEARCRWLTREEHRRLMLKPMPGRLRNFFILTFGTGCRARAGEEATWDRVDWKNRTIDFRVPGVRYKNKRRIVGPISDALYPRLRAMYERRTDDYVIGLGPSGRCTGTYHMAARVMKAAGIEGAVPRHVARHTFASWLLQAGVDIYTVALLLGDKVAMVEKVYGHMKQDNLLAAVNKLAA